MDLQALESEIPNYDLMEPHQILPLFLRAVPKFYIEVVMYHLLKCSNCQKEEEIRQAETYLLVNKRGLKESLLQTPWICNHCGTANQRRETIVLQSLPSTLILILPYESQVKKFPQQFQLRSEDEGQVQYQLCTGIFSEQEKYYCFSELSKLR